MFKLKPVIVNVLLALAAIMITSVCIEIIFRIFDIKPYPKIVKKCEQVEVNSKGRRDHGYDYKKPEGIFRIVAVGDSFTFGFGVCRLDDIFLMRLEKALNIGSKKYEVINGSSQGNTIGEYLWLKNEGVKFSPDLIIVVYFFNDATDTGSNPYISSKLHKESLKNTRRGSFLYNYLEYKNMRRIISKQTIREYKASYFDKSKMGLWNECKESILAIKKLAEEQNAKLLFVIFPILFNLDKNYGFQDIHDIILNFLKENKIAQHSFLPDFIAYKGKAESLWVNIDDAHPNEKAHAIAAKSLYKYLTNSPLLDK